MGISVWFSSSLHTCAPGARSPKPWRAAVFSAVGKGLPVEEHELQGLGFRAQV